MLHRFLNIDAWLAVMQYYHETIIVSVTGLGFVVTSFIIDTSTDVKLIAIMGAGLVALGAYIWNKRDNAIDNAVAEIKELRDLVKEVLSKIEASQRICDERYSQVLDVRDKIEEANEQYGAIRIANEREQEAEIKRQRRESGFDSTK